MRIRGKLNSVYLIYDSIKLKDSSALIVYMKLKHRKVMQCIACIAYFYLEMLLKRKWYSKSKCVNFKMKFNKGKIYCYVPWQPWHSAHDYSITNSVEIHEFTFSVFKESQKPMSALNLYCTWLIPYSWALLYTSWQGTEIRTKGAWQFRCIMNASMFSGRGCNL